MERPIPFPEDSPIVREGKGNPDGQEFSLPEAPKNKFQCCVFQKSTFLVGGIKFELDHRYKLKKPLGHGAYGVLCSAEDTKTSELVAIKKLRDVFGSVSEARRTVREVKLLRHLRHENVVSLIDIISPVSFDLFHDVYVVTELMDTDLHQIIKSKQVLSDSHIQYFIYQILRGLKYVHSAGVLHRDLKPSNILVNANCDCKIADFGMARTSDPIASEKYMTGYVTTRWYRAPEVILSWRVYTKAVDLWSVGCILAELVGRTPIFPGKDYNHQLRLIFTTLGTPTPSDIAFIQCADTKKKVLEMSRKVKTPLNTLYPHADPKCLSLLERLLEFVPKKRATVNEALQHPYLDKLHDPEDEPNASSAFDFEFERNIDLDATMCKRLLWKETCKYHPHLAPLTCTEVKSNAETEA
uniref:Mitogen-activated protein kinase n=1 Tax=Lotharella oceanica TaxID=641309 RepID=A0A7S2U0G4_9EUKA|eukprot:CAMPEP_0170194454 /NCGR_PEP_ID=MMETSP0040_2-20121228/59331_1 /TAXON_ID=641309 /ORGANISM="Lotharella oceanica, Strain CCMP622" /LENGTH=410 /DNA_ID=CAMNT_0010443377 /DNA_START=1 /DNA_END=1233 /DNA_ORIENTATION=+